jgi:phosphatidylcholine synthase
LFTASGLFAGFLAILAINGGHWRRAMGWLIVAQIIDGVDGTFARWFKTSEVLPNVNGKTMDHIIDFANYAVIPAYFFYSANLVHPVWKLPLSFLILLVSTIYYGKEGMVSDDNYFVGFPVMWNMVVFYLIFVFSFGVWGNAGIVVIFSILHFVPIKFAYPSRASRLKSLTILVSVILLFAMPVIVLFYPHVPAPLTWIAVGCLVYFGVLAAFDTFEIGRKAKEIER